MQQIATLFTKCVFFSYFYLRISTLSQRQAEQKYEVWGIPRLRLALVRHSIHRMESKPIHEMFSFFSSFYHHSIFFAVVSCMYIHLLSGLGYYCIYSLQTAWNHCKGVTEWLTEAHWFTVSSNYLSSPPPPPPKSACYSTVVQFKSSVFIWIFFIEYQWTKVNIT